MAQSRLLLQTRLENLLVTDEEPDKKLAVYFQPPEDVKMQYPCIVYSRDTAVTRFADNAIYFNKKRYQVTVIDEDPDSEIPDKVAALPLTSFDRFFVAENLNHDVFSVFF